MVLMYVGGDDFRARREFVVQSQPRDVGIGVPAFVCFDKVRVYMQLRVSAIAIEMPHLGLDAGLVADRRLHEKVVPVQVLVTVVLEAVGFVMELAGAPGPVIVHAAVYQVIAKGIVAPGERVGLQCQPVAREQRVELQEGRIRRSGTIQDEQVGRGQLRLHRCQVEGLQQL